MNEILMHDLYQNFSSEHGWLTKLTDTWALGQDEINYLGWLDDHLTEANKKVKLLENEVAREGGTDIYFLETDDEKMDAVCKQIAVVEASYDDAFKKDLPLIERQLILWSNNYHQLKKLRTKIRARTIHLKYPESMAITEREIVLAREFPLSSLVETNRAGFMSCPFHTEKTPSFKVKEYGYCFGCGAWCDSIKYQIEIRGMKFVDAVKSLQN